ncbi:MAG TPA: FAD-dependent oxidoreductase [Patescibacteria group bacterium]|nr:FAD-dependent oxidoreductase [Patescibacteria group bacterium]
MDNSPWLKFDRPSFLSLSGDVDSDIAIIGGGIAGVSTLYFLLKNTNKKVVLLEKNKIASGATGHNAGFAVNSMEAVTQELIKEFGKEKVKNGFSELRSAWDLLEKIIKDCGMDEINFVPDGGLVYTTIESFWGGIEEEMVDDEIGRGAWKYLLAAEFAPNDIDEKYKKYLEVIPQDDILRKLRIIDKGCVGAAIPKNDYIKKARVNSGELCYKIISFLKKNYSDRFEVFEQANISEIKIGDGAILYSGENVIRVEKVVLCTNAYNDFKVIINDREDDRLKKLGRSVGYMVAYDNNDKDFLTVLVFDERKNITNVPYFYYHKVSKNGKALAVVGGPEKELSIGEEYDWQEESKVNVDNVYNEFLERTFGESVPKFDYHWNGMMAYTPNHARWVGKDPKSDSLLYNLGCNGIGLLQSIMGGAKIARIINDETLASSMFDLQ